LAAPEINLQILHPTRSGKGTTDKTRERGKDLRVARRTPKHITWRKEDAKISSVDVSTGEGGVSGKKKRKGDRERAPLSFLKAGEGYQIL